MPAKPNPSYEERSLSPPPLKKRKIESTTTKTTVSNFFKPISKKDPEKTSWRVINDSLLLGRYQPHTDATSNVKTACDEGRRKIAAFDLDSTLIQTSSGKIFSRDATDWKWWHASVPSTLKQLYADGYNIAILTNQGSITLKSDPKTLKHDQRSLSNFKTKTSAILSHFDFPILLLAATARDVYRKPRTGMWDELLEELDLDEHNAIDVEGSFLVGDAAGRAGGEGAGGRKADHACSDRDFAANARIKFYTPEEYFRNEEPLPFTRDFEPEKYMSDVFSAATSTSAVHSSPIAFEKKNALDIVIMVGSPGSGKSTFFWNVLQPLGYGRVNQDTLKTRDKCVKVAAGMLEQKTAVAVDNTNADPATRAVWVDLAARFGVPVRCVHFTAPVVLCQHNDAVRALARGDGVGGFNPEKRVILPHSAFAGFRARFVEPSIKEGFQDVGRVDFVFRGSEEDRRVWCQYWI